MHSVHRELLYKNVAYRAATSIAGCRSRPTSEGDQDPGESYRVLAHHESRQTAKATRGATQEAHHHPVPLLPPRTSIQGVHTSAGPMQEERVRSGAGAVWL